MVLEVDEEEDDEEEGEEEEEEEGAPRGERLDAVEKYVKKMRESALVCRAPHPLSAGERHPPSHSRCLRSRLRSSESPRAWLLAILEAQRRRKRRRRASAAILPIVSPVAASCRYVAPRSPLFARAKTRQGRSHNEWPHARRDCRMFMWQVPKKHREQ